MKKIIKDKVYIFMIFLFIIFAFSTIIALNKYNNNQDLLIQDHKNIIEDCNKKNEEDFSEEKIKFCNKMIESDLSEYDLNAYDGYEFYIVDYLRTYLNEFIIIAVVISGSAYYVTKYLRNRIILSEINRKSYKKIIKHLFFSSWKYSILIPLMLITIFCIINIFIGGSGFKIGLSELTGTIFKNNLLLYFLVVLIQSFILSLIYVNINLTISRNEHNYILSIIKSYIFVIGLEIFFEVIVSPFLYRTFKSGAGIYFNIINIYNYTNLEDGLSSLFVLIGIMLFSFVPLFLKYRDKESLIIASEKNDNREEV